VSPDTDDLRCRVEALYDVMVVRDATYLNWRYATRPGAPYKLVEFRDSGGHLFGLSVLRHRWLDQPVTALAEILFERDHPSVPEAVAHLLALAGSAGDQQVKALLRPGSEEWRGLAGFGFVPEPSHLRFVARTYDRQSVPLDWLKDVWYVTLGDFDVV
jgi:hypothetical protein